jgi:hypothetical protein
MIIRENAFRRIQNDEHLYKAFVNAKTESERTDMLVNVAFAMGLEEGRRGDLPEYWND